jgi:hypothetical protein
MDSANYEPGLGLVNRDFRNSKESEQKIVTKVFCMVCHCEVEQEIVVVVNHCTDEMFCICKKHIRSGD